jgi:hypothetical protein
MTPEIETALKKAAVEARCIDADLVLTPIFADIVATVKAESDAPGAIEAMRQAKPPGGHFKLYQAWPLQNVPARAL